jgi:hypothetical protein
VVVVFPVFHQASWKRRSVHEIEKPFLFFSFLYVVQLFIVYLSDEVADDAAVVDAHARPVGVEDPSNPHLHQSSHQ